MCLMDSRVQIKTRSARLSMALALLGLALVMRPTEASAQEGAYGFVGPYDPSSAGSRPPIDVTNYKVEFEDLFKESDDEDQNGQKAKGKRQDANPDAKAKSSRGNSDRASGTPDKEPRDSKVTNETWEERRNKSLDAFEEKHPKFFNKRQVKYFDGSRTFAKGKFTVVSVKYPLNPSPPYEKISNAKLDRHIDDVGGSVLSQFESRGTFHAEVLVPNETVSTFVAGQHAEYGSNSAISRRGRAGYQNNIVLTVRFKELNEFTDALGVTNNRRLDVEMTTKEYRKLFKNGKLNDFKLRKLVYGQNKKVLKRRSSLPDFEEASLKRFKELGPRASWLRRLSWVPSKVYNALRRRKGVKLAKFRANSAKNIEGKRIDRLKSQELADAKQLRERKIRLAGKRIGFKLEKTKEGIDRDALLGRGSSLSIAKRWKKRKARKSADAEFASIVKKEKAKEKTAINAIRARAKGMKADAKKMRGNWKAELAYASPERRQKRKKKKKPQRKGRK